MGNNGDALLAKGVSLPVSYDAADVECVRRWLAPASNEDVPAPTGAGEPTSFVNEAKCQK